MDASVEDGYTLPMSLAFNNLVRPELVEGPGSTGSPRAVLQNCAKLTQWLKQPYPITVAGAVPDSLPSTR